VPSEPFTATAAGVRVAVRVQPGASRTGIDGLKTLDDGRVVLAIRVTAAAEGGKANAALIKLLAKTWKVPKSALEIVAGHGNRRKIVQIDGDPTGLQARLRGWLADFVAAEKGG
jgi:uncharacterized protein (TIGR00251 family)